LWRHPLSLLMFAAMARFALAAALVLCLAVERRVGRPF
jgi:hypothetical protein